MLSPTSRKSRDSSMCASYYDRAQPMIYYFQSIYMFVFTNPYDRYVVQIPNSTNWLQDNKNGAFSFKKIN